MKVPKELVDACYRQLTTKEFHVSEAGVTMGIAPADLALIRGAGEKKLKRALKLALQRKMMGEAAE